MTRSSSQTLGASLAMESGGTRAVFSTPLMAASAAANSTAFISLTSPLVLAFCPEDTVSTGNTTTAVLLPDERPLFDRAVVAGTTFLFRLVRSTLAGGSSGVDDSTGARGLDGAWGDGDTTGTGGTDGTYDENRDGVALASTDGVLVCGSVGGRGWGCWHGDGNGNLTDGAAGTDGTD